jgi:hypothetical protein
MLSGEGVIATTDGDAGITDGGGSKTSFYACGCRTFAPGGGAPIAFAVIWLVSRPRRRRLPLP